jgi:uncharacterized SAM-binding protein YcdF (DUF218 family)
MGGLRAAVKALIPGSFSFALLGLTAGVLLLFGPPRLARIGRRLLASVLGLYLVLSVQATSELLVAGLSRGYRPLRTGDDARGAGAIVVLGNGTIRVDLPHAGLSTLNIQSVHNVLEAARVHALLRRPILASGGPPGPASEAAAMGRALAELGIPAEDIALEPNSTSTRLQAVLSARWLKERGIRSVVLVTTPEHMWRATDAFRAEGLDPVPSISALRYGEPPFWRPTEFALQGSTNALYEYLARAFYWLRGWT